jgi:hypothetical protein
LLTPDCHVLPLHPCCLPLPQPWLLVGTTFILGMGERWYISIIASAAFTALVILVPVFWEYVLSEKQRQSLSGLVGKKKRGKSSSANLADANKDILIA